MYKYLGDMDDLICPICSSGSVLAFSKIEEKLLKLSCGNCNFSMLDDRIDTLRALWKRLMIPDVESDETD